MTKSDRALSRRAKNVWLHASVWYRRSGGPRYGYELSRPGYEENVALGDSEEEAYEALDRMIGHTDLEAIASEIAAAMVANAEGRACRGVVDGAILTFPRSSPRTQLGMGGNDELRDLILDALPDGWTYGPNGWWSPPDAPQTVAEMRRELEALRG